MSTNDSQPAASRRKTAPAQCRTTVANLTARTSASTDPGSTLRAVTTTSSHPAANTSNTTSTCRPDDRAATAASAAATTDLSAPLWTVEHLAALFYMTPDSAREYTYRADFPGGVKIGRRYLWVPTEVLVWVEAQPRVTAADRARSVSAVAPQSPVVRAAKPYKPRRGVAA